MFTPKDRTAYRYFHKRAHYIAVIASSLQALGNPSTKAKQDDMSKIWKSMIVEWDFEGGDMRRPILVMTFPKGKNLTSYRLLRTDTLFFRQVVGSEAYPNHPSTSSNWP